MKRILTLLLIAGLTTLGACQQNNNDDEGLAAALLLLAVADQEEDEGTNTTCSTSTASATATSGGSVDGTTYSIAASNLCYFTFTNNSGSTNNFTFRNTVNSGDTDLAYDSTQFESRPTNGSFWTNTGSNCTDGSGWNICLASTSSPETISITGIPNNTTVYLGIWAFSDSNFTFSVTQN